AAGAATRPTAATTATPATRPAALRRRFMGPPRLGTGQAPVSSSLPPRQRARMHPRSLHPERHVERKSGVNASARRPIPGGSSMRRTLAATAAGLVALTGALVLGATPARAASTAQLSVFHGVPGLTVDVYLDHKKAINDFKPGMMAGP